MKGGLRAVWGLSTRLDKGGRNIPVKAQIKRIFMQISGRTENSPSYLSTKDVELVRTLIRARRQAGRSEKFVSPTPCFSRSRACNDRQIQN